MKNLENLLDNFYFEENNILRKKLLEGVDDNSESDYFTLSVVSFNRNRRYLASVNDVFNYCKENILKEFQVSDFIKYLEKNRSWYDENIWIVDSEVFDHRLLLESDSVFVDDNFKIKKVKRSEQDLVKILSSDLLYKGITDIVRKKFFGFYGNRFSNARVNEFYNEFQKDKNLGKILDEVRACIRICRE